MNMNEISINELMADVLKKGLEAVGHDKRPQVKAKDEPEGTAAQTAIRTFVDPLALQASMDGMKIKMSENLKTEKYRAKMANTKTCDTLLADALKRDCVQVAVNALKDIILCDIRGNLRLYLNHLIAEEERELRGIKTERRLMGCDYDNTPAGEVGAVLKRKGKVA